MFTFLLVVQAIIAALLVTVILMQKSEGGGLGVGGSPAGFMSARGAADFLTRSTTILASVFVLLSIVMAVIASAATSTAATERIFMTPALMTWVWNAARAAAGEDTAIRRSACRPRF